jgi:hypothetical protein
MALDLHHLTHAVLCCVGHFDQVVGLLVAEGGQMAGWLRLVRFGQDVEKKGPWQTNV